MIIKNKYQLARYLHYNPITGEFTRLQTPYLGKRSCDSVGLVPKSILARGRVTLNGETYTLVRLAWLQMTGKLPERTITHLDGDTTNYKWGNLVAQRKGWTMRYSNTHKKYLAQILHGGKYIHAGYANTEAECEAQALAKKIELVSQA